jgi:V/A-type H+-transporting ATPase subunit I
VVFGKQYSEPVHKFLAMENINQIRLPSEFDGMPFDAAYDEIQSRRKELPTDLDDVRKELDEMSNNWRIRLVAVRNVLIDKTEEIDAIPQFGRTAYAFVINGWIPADEVQALRDGIRARWGEDVIVEQTEIDERDYASTPVALKNDPRVAPFQSVLGAYGMPRYGTIDPSIFLFIFFPLFFGMIVGDVGYGMIMLGIVVWLRLKFRENPMVQTATSILGPAATMVIVFGFVYGEFFGNVFGTHMLDWIQEISIGPLQLPFNRVESVQTFMFIAIGVGVVQVTLGLILGVINAVKTKNKHHLYEKGGILTFVVAILIVVVFTVTATQFGSWAIWGQMLFAVLAFAGFIFAVRGGGVMGVIETLEAFTGMASYIRIMAVGLAGAIFAEAINEIVVKMAQNTAMLVLAVIVAVVLHSLNFIISAFSPAIHAMRLNFLEFFRGFYETGNTQYSPFAKTGGEKGA